MTNEEFWNSLSECQQIDWTMSHYMVGETEEEVKEYFRKEGYSEEAIKEYFDTEYEIADIYEEGKDINAEINEDEDSAFIQFVKKYFDLARCVDTAVYLNNEWFSNRKAKQLKLYFRKVDKNVIVLDIAFEE